MWLCDRPSTRCSRNHPCCQQYNSSTARPIYLLLRCLLNLLKPCRLLLQAYFLFHTLSYCIFKLLLNLRIHNILCLCFCSKFFFLPSISAFSAFSFSFSAFLIAAKAFLSRISCCRSASSVSFYAWYSRAAFTRFGLKNWGPESSWASRLRRLVTCCLGFEEFYIYIHYIHPELRIDDCCLYSVKWSTAISERIPRE